MVTTESEAKRQLSALQPLIQEHHAGWQRLLAQQKKLDADQHLLSGKVDEMERSAETETIMRASLVEQVDNLMGELQRLRSFLSEVGTSPALVTRSSAVPRTSTTPPTDLF